MRHVFADYVLDTDRLTLTRSGQSITVEPQVFDLIRLLVENAGRVVTRDEMIDVVWNGRIVSESAISARIAAARKAVGDDGKRQEVIRTVARRGLQWVAQAAPNLAPQTAPTVQRIRYAATPEGHQIAYSVSGSGPPVVHSNPVMSTDLESNWRIPALRETYDAIARQNTFLRFDALGSGASSRDGVTFDFDALAEHMRIVADAAGFDRFALHTDSGGCLRAIHFAARYPERVTRLAITGGYVDGRLRRGSPETSEPIRGMIDAGWDAPRSGLASGYLLSYFPEGPLDAVRDIVAAMQGATSRDFALAHRDSINNASVADLLPHVQCPTLILHARDDAIHPLSQAREMAGGIAGAELVVLETANHMPLPGNAVYPDYLATLLGFLAADGS